MPASITSSAPASPVQAVRRYGASPFATTTRVASQQAKAGRSAPEFNRAEWPSLSCSPAVHYSWGSERGYLHWEMMVW